MDRNIKTHKTIFGNPLAAVGRFGENKNPSPQRISHFKKIKIKSDKLTGVRIERFFVMAEMGIEQPPKPR